MTNCPNTVQYRFARHGHSACSGFLFSQDFWLNNTSFIRTSRCILQTQFRKYLPCKSVFFRVSSSNILARILKTSFFIASPAPHFFCSGKGGRNQGSAADSLMSPAKWITSHNFAGLSPRAFDYGEKPIAFCSKFSVQN